MLCGRQTGKSTFASLYAVWSVIMWPETVVLLISPTLRQSTELFRKCTVLFEGLALKPEPEKKTGTELWLPNGSRIHSLPGANPEAIRGYTPDLIIEDEAAFVSDRTFTAIRPMLATKKRGKHILLTTPYGRRGHFYERWKSKDDQWARFMIRSSECPRIGQSFLEGEQRVLSERSYRQEYECEFLEAATAVFASDLLERLVDNEGRKVIMPSQINGEAQTVQSMVTGPGPWGDL